MWLAIFEKPFPGIRPVGHIGLHKSRIEPTRRNSLYISPLIRERLKPMPSNWEHRTGFFPAPPLAGRCGDNASNYLSDRIIGPAYMAGAYLELLCA